MLSMIEEEIELLQRHIDILKLVIKEEPIGIIKLSDEGKLPQHKIRYSLRILEQNGMIRPSQKGAVSTEKGKEFLINLTSGLDGLVEKIETLKERSL